MIPGAFESESGRLVYELKPRQFCKRSKVTLDSSDYTGKKVYRAPLPSAETGGGPARSAGVPPVSGLLKGHISSPSRHNASGKGTIEIWEGASIIQVTREITRRDRKAKKPERGRVREFSRASARRMRIFLAKVRLDEKNLPLFGTTTYPDIFPEDATKFKRDMQVLIERIKRRFPGCGLLWRLEFKRRKSGLNVGKVAPHYHWLLWGVPGKFDFKRETGRWVKLEPVEGERWKATIKHAQDGKTTEHSEEWQGQDRFHEWLSRNWYDITGTGDLRHYHAGTNVRIMAAKRQVFYYVSKYMGKFQDGLPCPFPGRFWGVVNPKNIPQGERKVIPCTGKQAAQLMRLFRRYIRSISDRKYRFNFLPTHCICNADFWAERIPKLLRL